MTKEELAKKKGKTLPLKKESPSDAIIPKDEPLTKNKQTGKPKTSPKEDKKKADKNASASDVPEKKRGRKKGSKFVPEEKQKESISISVSPADKELYKRIVENNPKRFKGVSQLIEQALDYFIRENNLD